jgi:hypothetical protein
LIALRDIVSADEKAAEAGQLAKEEKTNPPGNSAPEVPLSATNSSPLDISSVVRKQNRYMHAMAALRINVDREDYTDAIISAQSLATVDRSQKAQGCIDDLIAELQSLQSAQEKRATADVKTVLGHATAVVNKGSDPAEIDPLLVEIGAAMDRNRFGTFTPTHLALTSQLVDADRFLKQWQNYLADKKLNDKSACVDDLQRLCNMGETFRPIPRSQLLEWFRQARADQSASAR